MVKIEIFNVKSSISGIFDISILRKLKNSSRFISYQDRFTKRKFYQYLFDTKNLKFYTGILNRIVKVLKDADIEYELIDKRQKPVIRSIKLKKNLELRDYQQEAADIFLKKSRGLLNVGMRGGKTRIAVEIIRELGVPTLFIVPGKELLYQTCKVFKEYFNESIGVIGDGQYRLERINVGIINSVYRKRNNKEFRKFLDSVQLVIIDESHHLASNTYSAILRLLKKAYFRCGLSGTQFRNDFKTLKMQAYIGRVIFSYTLQDLTKDGYLNYAAIKMINSDSAYGDQFSLINDKERNNLIKKIALKESENSKQVLILVKHVKHGKVLEKIIKNSIYLHGNIDGQKRQKEFIKFKKGKTSVLIGTQIFYEGSDFSGWKNNSFKGKILIIAGAGKSNVETMQKMARMLTPEKGKQLKTTIYDFWDCGSKILLNHSKIRKSLYEKNGFNVEVKGKSKSFIKKGYL